MKTKAPIAAPVRHDVSLLSADDLYLFNQGRNYRAYRHLGAHPATFHGESGTCFSVWAPNARKVSGIGSFNNWNQNSHKLEPRGSSGIWKGFVPGGGKGSLSNFAFVSHSNGKFCAKSDPCVLS